MVLGHTLTLTGLNKFLKGTEANAGPCQANVSGNDQSVMCCV
jgi:hypothetical protein